MNGNIKFVKLARQFFQIFNNFGSSAIIINFLSLMIVALLLAAAAAIKVKAVCQTPQFALPVVLSVNRPVAVAPGDFNGDGHVDLAVLKDLTGQPRPVEVFLNNGSGVFASTGFQYNALQGSPIYDLAAADFNNDGKLDLAATGGSQSQAAILLGNGSGGFGAPTLFATGGNVRAVATGDFNNDGNIDIVLRGNNAAAVLPGLGNGSFNAPVIVSTDGSSLTNSIVARDFNGDGSLDFATVNTTPNNALSVKLGNGSFIFTGPAPVALPDPNNLTANDFNRDGKPDLAIVNFYDENVSVLFGAGDGTFNQPVGSPFPTNGDVSESIASADLNSDGFPDLAVGNATTNNSLSILLNDRTGRFGAPFLLSPEQNESEKIYPVDYNRNGATDLVIVKEVSQNKVVLMRNTCPPPVLSQHDFDGDGRADLAVFRPSDGIWYLLRSTAGFTGTQFGVATDKLTPADFDGDGKTDISVFRDGTWFWLNSSNGAFNAAQFGQAGDAPVPADYTGDGRAELAVYRGGIWYLLNLANNQFSAGQFGIASDKPVPADFDADGKTDLAVYRDGTWYLLRSSQGFTGVQFGIASDKAVVGDYDGDGRADPAVYRSGTWYILGSQAGFYGVQFGIATDVPAPADYDGDGKVDPAVYRDGVWYLLQSRQGFAGAQFGLAGDRPIPSAFVP
jgi:hypothetical protein